MRQQQSLLNSMIYSGATHSPARFEVDNWISVVFGTDDRALYKLDAKRRLDG